MTLRAAVFASGRGSNFRVLAAHARNSDLWEAALLLTGRPDAPVLDLARELGVEAAVLSRQGDPEEDAVSILGELEPRGIDFVLLAGYLQLIPAAVVERYRGRMLNLHPALLPSFGGKGMYGMHVHEAVLAAGVRLTGVTVHFANEEYDRGPILAQWPVPVIPGDTPESVARRIHAVEHRLFPAAADRLALAIRDGTVASPIPGDDAGFPLEEHLRLLR